MDKLDNLKVIDFHIHVGLKEHWSPVVHAYQKAAGSEFYKRYDEMIDPAKFAAYLKNHNIAKAVILPEISPITSGIVTNEYVFDFCRGRDIFVPFCTINPFMATDLEKEFKHCLEMGAKGLKLYPSYNHFYPNDHRIYGLYALAQENNLPVLVHTGSSVFKGSKLKYADPIHLDDVASDFPGLVLLLAHSGRGLWYDKAFFLSRLHPNIFLEISGLPPKNILKYFPDLKRVINKVVFGSDWPGLKSISENIETIKQLPLKEDSIRGILYDNAARILRI